MGTREDLLIIGGGITGIAAARDAAGRGLKVVLCEKNDIGSGTTSRSSRMAHGGLRYLRNGQVRLVFESLNERNRLFNLAPDFVHKTRFQLPVSGPQKLYYGAGLMLYDLLSRSKDAKIEANGFSFADGLCEPERLAAALAAEARSRGANIKTYTAIQSIDRDGKVITDSGDEFFPRAILVAAGPWTDRLLLQLNLAFPRPLLLPTRGTHLLMKTPVDRPYLLRASEGRIFFAVPAFGGTLVGTTDIDDASDPSKVRPRDEEIDYLLREIKEYLPDLGTSYRGAWTGVRPLVASGAAAGARSRGEAIVGHPSFPNIVVVVGGKLTTMRLMAERSINYVERKILNREPRPWTSAAPIRPSLEFPATTLSDMMLRRTYAGFSENREVVLAAARAAGEKQGWSPERFSQEMMNFRKEASEAFGLEI